MFFTTIKIISFLYPFLKELMFGKNRNTKSLKRLKFSIIILIIISVLLNFYMVKSSYTLSKDKIDNLKRIKELELKLESLKENKPKISNSVKPIDNNNKPNTIPNQPVIITRKEDESEEEYLIKKLKKLDSIEE